MTNFTNSNLQGEDRQKSKASAPGMARHEPPGRDLRRLYDLPVLSPQQALCQQSEIRNMARYWRQAKSPCQMSGNKIAAAA
ncbi:Yersinia protein of uncharacterised function (DUF3831) [Yersinia enterocolitica]|nr:Yersinia protein of uncharacterised function (DUF3831) [Yersinia enterocolitica]